MSEFSKVPLTPTPLWMRAVLFFVPTYIVLEGDSRHYFKMFRGKIYYLGEEIG